MLKKNNLENKGYCEEWNKVKLGEDKVILFQLEFPKVIKIINMRRRVFTKTLVKVTIAVYHYIPMERHKFVYKTNTIITARFYCTYMYKYI